MLHYKPEFGAPEEVTCNDTGESLSGEITIRNRAGIEPE
jgi:hypothetical protein